MSPILQIRQVAKHLGGRKILRDLDLDVSEGEVVSLLGPSGSGKTTLLRLIAGLDHPDAGRIDIAGRAVWSPQSVVPAEARHLGMVFQDYALWPHMNVEQNLAFGLNARRMKAAEIKSRIDHALEATQLTALRERKPAQLSGGQQQRVAIARCLAARPTLMLLDEPLSNLDAALREDLRVEMMRLVRGHGVTVVYVTHDQAEALAVSDKLAIMDAGLIVQTGAPVAVYDQPANAFVATFLGGFSLVPGMSAAGRFTLAGGGFSCASSLPDGPASLVARPEDVRPPAAHPETRIDAMVAAAAFQGRCWRLHAKVGDAVVRLDWPAAAAVGAPISFSLPPERCTLVPGGTEG